jgi:8-oxo-dGTP pyrophosphatase MutT (NUDIX family)
LKEALSQRDKLRLQDENWSRAAVLIPIYFKDGKYFIVFTRRTELVRYHKGEISFPGGGYHEEDGTLIKTALRESFEEIGLAPGDVTVLGELDDVATKGSHYIISPFVGLISPDYRYKLSSFETAEIIQISASSLLEKDCRREEPLISNEGSSFIPYVYAVESKLIIGATARILKQFLDIFAGVTHDSMS